MKRLYVIFFLLTLSAAPAMAQHDANELQWHTDLLEADQLSKATHKPIFAFFTGSDWCGWCHKLQADVFSKAAFINWAKEKVILVELDFPRRKQLPTELMQQNNSLQQILKVQGYPTIWYFTITHDSASKQVVLNTLGSQGYPAGAEPGKEEVKFLNEANAIIARFNGK